MVGSGEKAVSRPEWPRAGVCSWRGGIWHPSPPNQLEDFPVGFGAQPQQKLNLVHFSRKIWHLVTADDLYWTNAQKVFRPNIVDILILITILSKTSLWPKEQLARVGLQFKANFVQLRYSLSSLFWLPERIIRPMEIVKYVKVIFQGLAAPKKC